MQAEAACHRDRTAPPRGAAKFSSDRPAGLAKYIVRHLGDDIAGVMALTRMSFRAHSNACACVMCAPPPCSPHSSQTTRDRWRPEATLMIAPPASAASACRDAPREKPHGIDIGLWTRPISSVVSTMKLPRNAGIVNEQRQWSGQRSASSNVVAMIERGASSESGWVFG